MHRCFMDYVVEDEENAKEAFYVLALPQLTIYGHTIDHYTQARYPEDLALTLHGRSQGYEFGCWHSEACPDGEIGSNAVDGLRRISRDEFIRAWDEGWPQQEAAILAPVAGIYTIEPDGSVVKVWDSLGGDAA